MTFALLIAFNTRPSLAILRQLLYGNLIEQGQELAAIFPDDAIIIFERSLAGIHAQVSLNYIFDKKTLLFQKDNPDPKLYVSLLEKWIKEGKKLFLVVSEGYLQIDYGLGLVFRQTLPLKTLMLEQSEDRLPQRIENSELLLKIYQIVADRPPPSTIDIGNYESDGLLYKRGFYGCEKLGGQPGEFFRWTTASAEIKFDRPERLLIRMAGSRPNRVDPAIVSIWIGEELVKHRPILPNHFTDYGIPLPQRIKSEEILLRFKTTTFNPKRLELSTDGRDLVIMVSKIILK